MSQLGHDPHGCDLSMSKLRQDSQPVYQNRERLLSRCEQYEVSISTNLVEVYILQVNRRNYSSSVVIYIS